MGDAPRIIAQPDGVDLREFAGYSYVIEWGRCDTPEKILSWVLHLSEKRWATPRMLGKFAKACADNSKITIRLTL